jgi:tetratricopeptide (TPR) repeat protein
MKKKLQKNSFFDLKSYEKYFKLLGEDQDSLKHLLNQLLVENKSLKSSIGIDNDYLEAFYSLGYSRFKLHKLDEAKSIFQLLSILDHENPKYNLAIAACYRMQGDFNRAIIMYYVLINNHPKYVDAYINLSECLFKIEDWVRLDETFALIEKLIKLQPLSRFNQNRYQVIVSKRQLRIQAEAS